MSLDISLIKKRKECGHVEEFYSANITHNLGVMADEVGLYKILWRPNEMGITKAAQLISPLIIGLDLMRNNPERFKKFDAPNKWGTYDDFLPWLAKLLEACEKYPDAEVEVNRRIAKTQ